MSKLIAVAPMLDWTDRHCRYFHRQFSQHTVLYTEMVTTGAILFGQQDHLGFSDAEQPVVLQLGGSDPIAMAECTAIAAERGYKEVNINVGCPSERVQNGSFGACLMTTPETIAECVEAMRKSAPTARISVKTRLGIDDHDSDEFLQRFMEPVMAAGCQHFTLHARTAWLKGLSPKQNREIPPLQYDRVYRMKDCYPQLHISINGGIKTADEIAEHLQRVDGVMVGREAYQNPELIGSFDGILGYDTYAPSTEQVIAAMIPYIDSHVQTGGRVWHVVRHMLGLFNGQPGAKRWRQVISQHGPTTQSAAELFEFALQEVSVAREKFHQKVAEYAN